MDIIAHEGEGSERDGYVHPPPPPQQKKEGKRKLKTRETQEISDNIIEHIFLGCFAPQTENVPFM